MKGQVIGGPIHGRIVSVPDRVLVFATAEPDDDPLAVTVRKHYWTYWRHNPMGGFWYPDDRVQMQQDNLPREPFLTILLQPSRRDVLRRLRNTLEWRLADWLEGCIWKGTP